MPRRRFGSAGSVFSSAPVLRSGPGGWQQCQKNWHLFLSSLPRRSSKRRGWLRVFLIGATAQCGGGSILRRSHVAKSWLRCSGECPGEAWSEAAAGKFHSGAAGGAAARQVAGSSSPFNLVPALASLIFSRFVMCLLACSLVMVERSVPGFTFNSCKGPRYRNCFHLPCRFRFHSLAVIPVTPVSADIPHGGYPARSPAVPALLLSGSWSCRCLYPCPVLQGHLRSAPSLSPSRSKVCNVP